MEGGGGGGGVDRLSELPEEIFLHILSKLKNDSESVYRVCSLSKQWLKLPDLFSRDFTFGNFWDRRRDSRLLDDMRNVAKVGKLQFTHSPDESYFQETFFELARDRHVHSLIINSYYGRSYLRPDGRGSLRELPSLKTLHLSRYYLNLYCGPSSSYRYTRFLLYRRYSPFPLKAIRTLVLVDCVIFLDACDFSTCWPNLNELRLVGCQFLPKQEPANIVLGSQLAKLTMESNKFPQKISRRTQVSGPGVKFFRLVQECRLFQHLSLPEVHFPSLEEAEVDVSYYITDYPKVEVTLNEISVRGTVRYQESCRNKVCLSLFHLLRCLGNAEFVSLSSATTQVLSLVPAGMVEHQPPLFNRLKSLKLEENLMGTSQPEIPAEVMKYLLHGLLAQWLPWNFNYC
ncbi:hypothetical protein Tsubulata_037674 [Turnera subulata]|uniref:F-box domain-containing protein n=1 Tax=Turnera subulata TaxID=218843 RepID=A0A9Q0GAK9_9ROSI|nr:hypothetical protein Tsubulata_037674 [Turnera subulata]